jgi:hypothetical protein
MHAKQKLFAVSFLILTLSVIASSTVFASQGFYTTTANIRKGMLVSLSRNPGVVEPSTDKTTTALVGVVGESPNDGPLQSGQISVQTDGLVEVLVSNAAGDVKVGDKIGPSSIVGFGAKVSGSGWVVGTAQEEVNAATEGAVSTTVLDSAGKKRDVYVASIPIQIKVFYDAKPAPPSPTSSKITNEIQSVADSVAGKRASTAAIILSFILILSGVVIAGLIVIITVKKGIESIARQPLVKQTIVGRMMQSFGVALAIIVSVNVGALVLLRIL